MAQHSGCGMLKPAMLREAGHDPDQVQGYAYGIGLESWPTQARTEKHSRTVAPALSSASAVTLMGRLSTGGTLAAIEVADGLAG